MNRVLVVCTANICRSPMAEAFLLREAAARGSAVALTVGVASAGVLAADGIPAADGSVRAMGQLGVDLSAHRSRRVTEEIVRGSDLILTMEASHVRTIVVDVPEAFARTFTWRELITRVESGENRDWAAARAGGLESWIEVMGQGRSTRALLSAGGLDVTDPYGRSSRVYRRCARDLAAGASVLAEALWGPPVAPGGG